METDLSMMLAGGLTSSRPETKTLAPDVKLVINSGSSIAQTGAINPTHSSIESKCLCNRSFFCT